MIKQSSTTTLENIDQRIWQHLEERDWTDNTPRSLAISISLEANELLEHYQWGEKPVGDRQALAEELADILIYAFEFAQKTNIDIAAAIEDKLQKTAKKYPAGDFKNKTREERKANWRQAKLNHHKEGL